MKTRHFTQLIAGHQATFTLHIDDNYRNTWTVEYCGRTIQASADRWIDQRRGQRWLSWARNNPGL